MLNAPSSSATLMMAPPNPVWGLLPFWPKSSRDFSAARASSSSSAAAELDAMADEKNPPQKHPGQDDAPKDSRDPIRPRDSDASGDPLDGTGEDNPRQKGT